MNYNTEARIKIFKKLWGYAKNQRLTASHFNTLYSDYVSASRRAPERSFCYESYLKIVVLTPLNGNHSWSQRAQGDNLIVSLIFSNKRYIE